MLPSIETFSRMKNIRLPKSPTGEIANFCQRQTAVIGRFYASQAGFIGKVGGDSSHYKFRQFRQ